MEIHAVVCKLGTGPECSNGSVTGTVIVHPCSAESNGGCVRGAAGVFQATGLISCSPHPSGAPSKESGFVQLSVLLWLLWTQT